MADFPNLTAAATNRFEFWRTHFDGMAGAYNAAEDYGVPLGQVIDSLRQGHRVVLGYMGRTVPGNVVREVWLEHDAVNHCVTLRKGTAHLSAYYAAPDTHGNVTAREGLDRCECGSKYWENDRCIDCGTSVKFKASDD